MRQRPFIWEGTSITLFTVLKCCIEGISGSSNRSLEHVIRAELLHDYDKTVTPILGQKPLTVLFEMKIVRLLKVVSTVQPYSLNNMLKFWLSFMRLNSQRCCAKNCWELLRQCWQWCANGCDNYQQCWDLQCIMGRIQSKRLWNHV